MTKHLLVCSGGGHLKQLFALAARVGIAPADQQWVTFDTGLSRTLLSGRDVVFAPYLPPRDIAGTLRVRKLAKSMIDAGDFGSALSTGAGLAVAFLPYAARRGVSSHYIESAARANGPSLTGKLVALDKRVHTYAQYPAWSTDRWVYRGSIYDSFAAGPAVKPEPISKVVVTVGTTESYDFRRLFDRLVPLLEGRQVLWQVGTTDVSDLGIDGRETVPHEEMRAAIRDADVVITHSGTGSAMTAMDFGKCPVLVPRLKRYGEHVDDHQIQIAHELARRDLAIAAHVEDLSEEVLARAAAKSVQAVADAPPFILTATAKGPRTRMRTSRAAVSS